jgi:hypothetical protein
VLQADGALQFYVWRDLVFDAWRHGNMPFWNPYELAGTPLLANSQSAALYPPHVLMGILHVPSALAITLLAWFHLFWAGLGTSKLVRTLGGTEIGGVVAGASFALSPFMLSWTALSSVITTVCWIPWLLFAGWQCFGPLRRSVLGVAVSSGFMFLGGHLQFAAYGIGALLLIGLLRFFFLPPDPDEDGTQRRRSWPSLGGVVLGLALGCAIAAPQLLPVLQYSQTSHRRGEATEAGYEAYVASAIKPFELANLITSKALGDPRVPVRVTDKLTVAEYWPPLAKQGANFAESAVTIGPLVLGLLFLAPWRERQVWPIAAIGVLALLLAVGTVLNKLLYFGLPGWSSTGSPGRIIVLFVLAACVLGGLGVQLDTQMKVKSAYGPTITLIFLALLTIPLAGSAPSWQAGMEPLGQGVQHIAEYSSRNALLAATVVGVLGIAVWLVPPLSKFRTSLVAFPILVAIAGYATNFIPTGTPPERMQGPKQAFQRVAILNDNWGIIAPATSALLPPNLAAYNRIHELAGYDSLLNRDTKKLLDDVNGQDSAPPANGNMMFIKPTADRAKLAEAGVSEVWARGPGGNLESEKLSGPGRASIDGRNVPINSESYTSVRMTVQGPGRLVLRDRNMPGWLPKIDGQHVPLAGTTWLELDIPSGSHQVEFNYVAPGFMSGVYLAFMAWIVMAWGLVLSLAGRRTIKKA